MIGARLDQISQIGLALIMVGVALFLLPFLIRYIEGVERLRLHPFILYVYRGDGFIFATSPALIAVFLAILLISILGKG